jgi:hypothetical protein
MTRYYGQPITVTCAQDGQPDRFIWHGREYVILEVLATWHLRDHWWLQGLASAPHDASNRTYYRARCADQVYVELYYEAVGEQWILDRLYD